MEQQFHSNRFYTSLATRIACLEMNQKEILEQLKILNKNVSQLQEETKCMNLKLLEI
jgi:hypothetical protein